MWPGVRHEAAPKLTEDAASHHGQYEGEMRWQLSGRGGNKSSEDSEEEADAVDYRHILFLLQSGERLWPESRALSGPTQASSVAL